MTSRELTQIRESIEGRRAERELLFWTVRQVLLLIILAACSAGVVISVAEGDPFFAERILSLFLK